MTVTAVESCQISDTTAASCVVTFAVALDGTSTSRAPSTALMGTHFHRYQDAITAGAEKTAAATDVSKACGDAKGDGAVGRGMWV